jgi:hypothetical protein
VGATHCVALTAGSEDQSGSLGRRVSQGLRNLVGKAIDYQRMARVDVVVVNDSVRTLPPSFRQNTADCLALKQVEIQSDRQDEGFRGVDGVGE